MPVANASPPGGWSKLPKWFVNDYAPILTGSQLRVYLVLLSRSQGWVVRASHKEIAEWTGLTFNAKRGVPIGVKRDVKRLMDLGLIHRLNMPHNGVASEYVIAWRRPSRDTSEGAPTHARTPSRGTSTGAPYKKTRVGFTDDGPDEQESVAPSDSAAATGCRPIATRSGALEEWAQA